MEKCASAAKTSSCGCSSVSIRLKGWKKSGRDKYDFQILCHPAAYTALFIPSSLPVPRGKRQTTSEPETSLLCHSGIVYHLRNG